MGIGVGTFGTKAGGAKRRGIAAAFQFYAPEGFPLDRLAPFVPHLAADELACRLARAGDGLGVALARTAAAFVAKSGWTLFGYARIGDFTRVVLDRSGHWLRDFASLGQGLAVLPGLEAALAGCDGKRPLGRVAATCIARVATSESLQAWVELARRSTVRELQKAGRAARGAGSSRPTCESDGQDAVSNQMSGAGSRPPQIAATGSHPAITRQLLETTADSSPVVPSFDLCSELEHASRRVLDEEPEASTSCRLRLWAPEPIAVAFEETLDLHRALSGHQASVDSFAEALSAEAAAGLAPPDVSILPRLPHEDVRVLEMRLARDTRGWAHLPSSIPTDARLRPSLPKSLQAKAVDRLCNLSSQDVTAAPGAHLRNTADSNTQDEIEPIRAMLRRLEVLSKHAGEGEAPELARQLRELVALENEIEGRLGRLLNDMSVRGDWASLRFANLGQYAEERLGISRRTAERRAGIVGALRHLPRVLAAYEAGKVGLQAAWIVRRILGPRPVESALEDAWISRAREATVKRLGDEARRIDLCRHGVLALEGSETTAGETSGKECKRTGAKTGPTDGSIDPRHPANDAAWQASLYRAAGMAPERIFRLGRLALELACDNVFIRLQMSDETAAVFLASIESARLRLEAMAVESRDSTTGERMNGQRIAGIAVGRADEPPSKAAARELFRRRGAVPTWVGLLALLEDYALTWDDPRAFPEREWEETYNRDGWRCMAPGCTGRQRMHDHHLVYRSRNGSDDLVNQLTLCAFHHQQGEHGRFAHCAGKAPLEVLWRLGTPELGTWFMNERRLPGKPASAG